MTAKMSPEYQRQYYLANKERIYNSWLKRRYNITRADFQELLRKQAYGCAICGDPFSDGTKVTKPHVDHDHACCPGRESCGKCIRGILCYRCNQGLGSFKDDPMALMNAAQYLIDQGTDVS